MNLPARRAALPLSGAVAVTLASLIFSTCPAQAQGISLPGAPFQPTHAPFQPAPFQGNHPAPEAPPQSPSTFTPFQGSPFQYGSPYGDYGAPYSFYGTPYGGYPYSGSYGGYGTVIRPGWQWRQNDDSQYIAPPPVSAPGISDDEGTPALLNGYYFGDYTDTDDGYNTYPAVYSAYAGFPSYIYAVAPGVVYDSPPPVPAYLSVPQSFYPPVYTVTYNQNNYYFTNGARAAGIAQGGVNARKAVKLAYPSDSYQATFADIERAWNDGDIALLKKHLQTTDAKVSVFLNGAYKYSLNPADFAQITRDAFDKIDTVAFKFTALQRAKNGDLTAYGTHVYRASGGTGDGEIVPFDADASPTDADTTEKTVYVSYTLRHGDNGWYVTAIDSSSIPLVKAGA